MHGATRINVSSSANLYPSMLTIPGNANLNPINTGTPRNVQSLAVFPAKLQIADHLRHHDGPDMFAFGRNDPYAARTRAPHVPLGVHPQTVRHPFRRIGRAID